MLRWFENLLSPYPDAPPSVPPTGFFAFIWACTQGARRYIVSMTALAALIGAFEALLFAMMGVVVDWLGKIAPAMLWQQQRTHLIVLVILILGSTVLVALQTFFKHQTLAGSFPMRLRWNFHRLMLNQSMGFHQDEFSGRIAAKVMQTALAVRDVCMTSCDILVFVVIYFVTLAGVLGAFDAWLLTPFLVWVAMYLLALRWFVPRLGRVSRMQADARSLMTGRITDAYTNIGTIKLFSHAGREARYVRSAMQEFMGAVQGQMRLISGFEIVNHAMSMLLILGAAGTALWLWSIGQIGVGAAAAATAMALRLNGMSHWVMWEMASLFEQVGVVQDGINTLSRHHAVTDAVNAKPLHVTQGELHFENVCFSWDGEKNVIEHFNLKIAPGEKVGLVGRSGAGKSTLVNLLLRFYDVGQGRILIDKQDIAQVTQHSLREQIGMVTQDTSLLHRSVRENILYGKPDATEEAMQKAARRAQAHDFIQTLSDIHGRNGYDAHVGERGVKLSGGQRQRIAIARVMLKDAPILLLDEATSALDSEAEVAIQSSLSTLMQGKTVVAIAHRLSTIAAMDRLIVLDQGRIAEEGTHHELLKKGGLYARLWQHQSGGFLGEDKIAQQD